ncbi:MAG: DUF433 domain-containing protein [Caldilineaceae bacterium]
MLVKTAYEHIYTDENGVPQIADANTKVIELVLDHIAYGWSPEELVHQHPHLTLGQVHSALAYYWDHQSELDLDIQQRPTMPTKCAVPAARLALRGETTCLTQDRSRIDITPFARNSPPTHPFRYRPQPYSANAVRAMISSCSSRSNSVKYAL